ncbi:probable chitinase 10 [Artemia franciscana]|uniref:probable chitinase 10 n=1 Tax=Artemia franciscana TaxID=6661 RepID=UPI0032DA3A12
MAIGKDRAIQLQLIDKSLRDSVAILGDKFAALDAIVAAGEQVLLVLYYGPDISNVDTARKQIFQRKVSASTTVKHPQELPPTQICSRIQKGGWTVVQDPESRMGPYAYKGNQWVSFDDADMIKRKAQKIKDWDLAGVIVWAPDLDDFRNKCGCEPHPLLRALNRGLGRLQSPDPQCEV